jgi:hypothetical protein
MDPKFHYLKASAEFIEDMLKFGDVSLRIENITFDPYTREATIEVSDDGAEQALPGYVGGQLRIVYRKEVGDLTLYPRPTLLAHSGDAA